MSCRRGGRNRHGRGCAESFSSSSSSYFATSTSSPLLSCQSALLSSTFSYSLSPSSLSLIPGRYSECALSQQQLASDPPSQQDKGEEAANRKILMSRQVPLLLSFIVMFSLKSADAYLMVSPGRLAQTASSSCTFPRNFFGETKFDSPKPPGRTYQNVISVQMSKKDKRYKLARRGANEDELLLTVAEQFRRREGQAQISWYPGHIAKAEKVLQEVLSAVDVVVEVRDARIPISTSHPMIDNWLKNRKATRIVCMSKVDMVPASSISMWKAFLENSMNTTVVFMNCKEGGDGLIHLKRAIKKERDRVNTRREERGIAARNVKVAVIGYPNVGKSALLNRLAGMRKAKSENRAGVTKSLQWSRVEGYDLLDSPGIIPAKLLTQEIALHLAICDDIGKASYDTILVAAHLVDEIRKVGFSLPSYVDLGGFQRRYNLPIGTMSGEEYIFRLAHSKFFGLELPAAERILDDFRGGRLGVFALEPPPTIPYHTGYYRALGLKPKCTAEDIKKAYREKARVLHPDFGGDPVAWQKLLKSYEILSEPESRKLYDEHGLVWDIAIGNYRVLQPGEVKPTMETGQKLLKGSPTATIRTPKIRKGLLRLSIASSSASKSALYTKPPPGRPPMRQQEADF
eukprot:767867-Hanusia_phi.AAC.4